MIPWIIIAVFVVPLVVIAFAATVATPAPRNASRER